MKKPILIAMFLLCLMILPVIGMADAAVDPDRDVSLDMAYRCDDAYLTGLQVDIYRVADVNAEGEYTLSGAFASYSVSLKDTSSAAWKALAETLATYVERDHPTPADSGKTNSYGAISFPNQQTHLQAGLYLVMGQQHIQDGYTYVSEPFLVALPYKVEDDWDYSVYAEPKYTRYKIPSEESTVERKVLKVWQDDAEVLRPTEIVVQLLKDGSVYDTVTLNKDNNWRHSWSNLPEFNDDGTCISWRMVEQVPRDYSVLITQEGTSFVVTNTYTPEEPTGDTTRRSVIKVWNDKNYETKRPQSVKISLKCNDETYDTQVLSAANNWRCSWDTLPRYDADGNENVWTLEEEKVNSYVGSLSTVGYTFILTNSYTGKIPQTGLLWWPVPLLIAGGLALLIVGIMLRKRNDHA